MPTPVRWRWLSLVLVAAACAPASRHAADEAAAMRRVLDDDTRLGGIRNHASETKPLADAIRDYVAALDALDFDGCPREFTDAFRRHRDAWEAAIEFFDRFRHLRGELHALFEQLRAHDARSKERMEAIEAAVSGTWAEVEAAVESVNEGQR